jgi:hypothetical protein
MKRNGGRGLSRPQYFTRYYNNLKMTTVVQRGFFCSIISAINSESLIED